MTIDRVRAAYTARAAEYIDVVGGIEHAAQRDRDLILSWARGIEGRVLDVGCGPGQWTNHLRGAGIDVEGIDPTEAFVERATVRYPDARYRVARAEELGVGDGALGGILAWFSLIHTAPDAIAAPLAEFARCLGPGGGLLLGFFDGPAGEPFDHAVTTAYFWSAEALTGPLERAGFIVTEARTRVDPGARPQGTIIARRR
ncbi:class I SAM-dependent methyltransferase [Leucobacter sp.]